VTAAPTDARGGRLSTPLTFDRATGRLDGANGIERLASYAMQLGVKATAPFHHRGLSLGCRILRTALSERDIVVRLSQDAVFAFPFADGYWTRLLDPSDVYEPEIDAFLRSIADVDFTFVDCGANFGLWSTLITSRAYGAHDALAIEASAPNAERLRANARLNGDRFAVLERAVAGQDGGRAWITGFKHEGMTIAGTAAGTGQTVAMVSLDGLVDAGLIRPGRKLVVKLDVEGVEVEALKGGRRALSGDAVVICEDHGSDRSHRVSRFLLDETPWTLFAFDPRVGGFVRLTDIAALEPLKTSAALGFNVFAATSPFFADRLAALRPTTRH
jgi:FkbM family methyltransferase